MKNLKLIIPVLFILILAGCSSVRYTTDFDRKADFRKYKTFNFSKEADRLNLSGLNRQRLKENITAQMEAKGYTLAASPDLLVNVMIKGKTKTTAMASTNHWGGPFGYYRGWGFGSSNTWVDINRYVEGTLFIDLIDVMEKRTIWEGIAEGLINPRTETTEKDVNKVVERIFNDFPL